MTYDMAHTSVRESHISLEPTLTILAKSVKREENLSRWFKSGAPSEFELASKSD